MKAGKPTSGSALVVSTMLLACTALLVAMDATSILRPRSEATDITPDIIYDLRAATNREEAYILFCRLATNSADRVAYFNYIDSDPGIFNAVKAGLEHPFTNAAAKLSVQPRPLPMSNKSPPHSAISAFEFTFNSPWDRLSVVTNGPGFLLFEDDVGRGIMFSRISELDAYEAFARYDMGHTNTIANELIWMKALGFPGAARPLHREFLQSTIAATPQDLHNSETAEDLYRFFSLLGFKRALLTSFAEPTIYEISSEQFTGYQFGADDKPGRYDVRLFRPDDLQINLAFGCRRSAPSPITQADVNCVLDSLTSHVGQNDPMRLSP